MAFLHPFCPLSWYLFALDSQDTELHKRVSLAEIHFLLLLCNNIPAYEISYL
jgi:hypothetical protein